MRSVAIPETASNASKADKLVKTEQIANLITECLDHFRHSGFTLSTLIHFLDEMRKNGHSEVDVQAVDSVMRHILKHALAPDAIVPP
jgi:hypothetical protein